MVVVGGAWRIIPVNKPFASLLEFGDLEGEHNVIRKGDENDHHGYEPLFKSWDDPPSRGGGGGRGGFSDFLGMKLTSTKNLMAVLERLP